MPIAKSLYKSLIKQHGFKKGSRIYFAMEKQNKGSFRKSKSTAEKRGHVLALKKSKSKKTGKLRGKK